MSYDRLFDETIIDGFYTKYNDGENPIPSTEINIYDVNAGDIVTADSANGPHEKDMALKVAILALDDWCANRAVWRLKNENIITSTFRWRIDESGGDNVVIEGNGNAVFGGIVTINQVKSDSILYTSALTFTKSVAEDVAQFDGGGNLVPIGTRTLGDSSHIWDEIYGDTCFCGTLTHVSGTVGINANFQPTTNLAKNIGGASNKFLEAHFSQLNVDDVRTNLVPYNNLALNLGDPSHYWSVGFIDHLFATLIDEAFVKTLLPVVSSDIDLGAVSNRFKNGYFTNLYSDVFSTNELDDDGDGFITLKSSIVPDTNGAYHIGEVGKALDYLLSNEARLGSLIGIGGNAITLKAGIFPDTNDAYAIGALFPDRKLANVISTYATIDEIKGFNCDGDIIPSDNLANDLGAASTGIWDNLFVNSCRTADFYISGYCKNNFNPGTNTTFSLGNGSYKWLNLYVDHAYLFDLSSNSGGDIGLLSNLIPGTDNSKQIGKDNYALSEVFSHGYRDVRNTLDIGKWVHDKTDFFTIDKVGTGTIAENVGASYPKYHIVTIGELVLVRGIINVTIVGSVTNILLKPNHDYVMPDSNESLNAIAIVGHFNNILGGGDRDVWGDIIVNADGLGGQLFNLKKYNAADFVSGHYAFTLLFKSSAGYDA